MDALIIRPDRTVVRARPKGRGYFVHREAVYMLEPKCVRKLNGRLGKPGELHDTPVGIWVEDNPVPVGLSRAEVEEAFSRAATGVWLTRTLESLAAPGFRLPGKYVMWFVGVLVVLGVLALA